MALVRGNGPLVSLMFPCRERFRWLHDAAISFLQRSKLPGAVEVMVRVDDDDRAATEAEKPFVRACLERGACRVLWQSGDRFRGYLSLHDFYNSLAASARGDWLWLLNDDARCLTEGWDAILETVLNEPPESFAGDSTLALVNPGDAGFNPSTVFPMIRRAGADLVGRFSPSPVNDHHLNEMYHLVGCDHSVPQIRVGHINNDPAGRCASRTETLDVMGAALAAHHAPPVADEVAKDLAKLRQYLASRTPQ